MSLCTIKILLTGMSTGILPWLEMSAGLDPNNSRFPSNNTQPAARLLQSFILGDNFQQLRLSNIFGENHPPRVTVQDTHQLSLFKSPLTSSGQY